MSEHPFAQYVRILGKGPHLSRPLTLEETRAAGGMIMRGAVEPIQLGAFLCLLRVKTETPAEMAGFSLAVRDHLDLPKPATPVDVDWPSYAGKARRAPLFILAALLLAQNGVRIAMHGTEGHTAGRLYTKETLAGLGIPPAESLTEAATALDRHNFAYVPLELLHPRLPEIMALKRFLGLRSPLHSVLRHINPFDAKLTMISVFHPNYRPVHRDAAMLMGMGDVACFKGDGGEVERRPEKPCVIEGVSGGAAYEEEWPALIETIDAELPLEPEFLAALWRGESHHPVAETIVTATAALVLRHLGRADNPTEADELARHLWMGRRRDSLAA